MNLPFRWAFLQPPQSGEAGHRLTMTCGVFSAVDIVVKLPLLCGGGGVGNWRFQVTAGCEGRGRTGGGKEGERLKIWLCGAWGRGFAAEAATRQLLPITSKGFLPFWLAPSHRARLCICAEHVSSCDWSRRKPRNGLRGTDFVPAFPFEVLRTYLLAQAVAVHPSQATEGRTTPVFHQSQSSTFPPPADRSIPSLASRPSTCDNHHLGNHRECRVV